MDLRNLFLLFFIVISFHVPGGANSKEINSNRIANKDESFPSRLSNGPSDSLNSILNQLNQNLKLSIDEEDSEIEMQVFTTKSVTYILNVSNSISIEQFKLLIQLNSTEYGIVQDIELAANFQNNKSKITVPLHSLHSGKTQFYVETLMVLHNSSTMKCPNANTEDHCVIKIMITDKQQKVSNAVVNVSVFESTKLIDIVTLIFLI